MTKNNNINTGTQLETVNQLKNHIKKFTVKELKKEIKNVKYTFQVSKLRRAEVEQVILKNYQYFTHLLQINKTKKSNKKAKQNYTIVYYGAGWDFRPVNMQLFQKINHFIFIDALPKLQHYQPNTVGYNYSKDRKTFINTLINTAKSKGYKLDSIKKDLLTFTKKDKKIEYYINTTVEDSLKNPAIRKKINKAIWVHQAGFFPYAYGLKAGDLPNLKENMAKLRTFLS